MHVHIDGDRVTEVQLEIYEPPRFFEALLVGRKYTEAPDITARVCGICPVAYQMSACQAVEDACGSTVDESLADLRRLLYCGEWIESHALHIYLLHAPDFLGYAGAVELARDHRAVVERGLSIKKAGNELLTLLGGRAIHPVNVKVGGFYRTPTPEEPATPVAPLPPARDGALSTVEWVAGFEFPAFAHAHSALALVSPGSYAIEAGGPATDPGLTLPGRAFEGHVIEEQVRHSPALHAPLAGRGPYLTRPTAPC